ncbi:MAG TPA: histidine kinase [Pedobacter sp.]
MYFNISLLAVFILLSAGLALINRKYVQPALIHNYSPINYLKYTAFWLFQFIYYLTLGSGYFFVKEFIREKVNSSNLEKEKTTIESNLLRSQINPHFLFNTLNVLYAKSIVYSEDLADKIQKLSEIMRYAYLPKWLKDGSHAPVSEEIKHISNIIIIHEFRLSNKNIFHFKIDGSFEHVFLPPLVLVTLVENILKHGHLTTEAPAIVLLKHENGILTYQSKNKVKTAKNHDEKSGIGVQNIKLRLDRYFKNDFTFTSEETGGYYYIQLIINLERSL